MFVERMLEYRKKFEVGLSTFPDSTNTETPKNWFLAWRVSLYLCVCVCVSVCLSVRKSLSVDILRKSWPIWTQITVYVAIGVESRTSPNQYNRTIISP